MAPNMDAGNYELYGNHYWTTGSLYLDGRELLEDGAELTWLESHNTWNFDSDTDLGRASYLPAYPVLLGIAKATYATAVASPLVNALLAALSALVMVLIGLQLFKARFVVAFLVAGIVLTPLFFYYGKQLMSEQLGLLGMLLVVYSLLESRGLVSDAKERGSSDVATLGVTVGMSLGLLSRLDFIPVSFLLVGGLVVLEFDAWSRGDRGMQRSFFLWIAATAIASLSLVAAVGHPAYLDQGQPDVVSELVNPRIFLVLYGLVTGFALVLVGVVRPILTMAERRLGKDSLVRWGQVLAFTVAGLWAAFIVWSLVLRPEGFGPSPLPHDAENLLRLLDVTSPLLLGLTLLLSPWILISKRPERGIVIMLAAGLGFVLFASRHTAPDVWWMRRYLHYVMPLMLVVLAGAIGEIQARLSLSRRRLFTALGATILAIAALNAWSMKPLFAAQTNPDVPARLAQLMREVPDQSLIVVLEGDSILRGLANTYRSLTGQEVLVDVPADKITEAASVADPGQDVTVLSSSALPQVVVEVIGLQEDRDLGTIERQWVNSLGEIYAEPGPSQTFHYFIYHGS